MSTNRGMNKKEEIHIHNVISLSNKRQESKAICSNLDGPRLMMSEVNQTKKDKYHMIWLICTM